MKHSTKYIGLAKNQYFNIITMQCTYRRFHMCICTHMLSQQIYRYLTQPLLGISCSNWNVAYWHVALSMCYMYVIHWHLLPDSPEYMEILKSECNYWMNRIISNKLNTYFCLSVTYFQVWWNCIVFIIHINMDQHISCRRSLL